MNLCSSGHDEICFEGRDCPCCRIIADLGEINDELKERIDTLIIEAQEYENKIIELEYSDNNDDKKH